MITYNYGNDGKTGWNYLLTSYDADSDGVVDTNEKISYDGIGNPLTYRGATLAWYGRQLRSFTKNGITSTMNYDADGLRSSKTVAGVKTEYQYVGDKLFYEKRGDGNSFYYFYDSYGKLSAIYHHVNGNKTAYHVVTNAQGDVIALYSWPGYLVASYEYDAWGNIISVKDANGNAITSQTHIAHLNPFRYRSYYYDKDLGLYYLQSRYYDSEIGRFINADNQIAGVGGDVRGYNMYSYCMNNPVDMTDVSGNWPNWSKLVSGIGLAVTGMAAVAAAVTATCVAAPVVVAVAIAGAACMAMGASEIEEAFNGYNLVKEEVFNGNEQAYNAVRTVASTAASLGTSYINSVTGAGNIQVCFVAGTYILAHLRNKKIEDIRVGDKVWAENPETGEKELKTVVQTFVNETNELVHVFVNNEEIITTPNHPFYVPQKGWVSAIKLRVGDILVLRNGKYVIIEQIQHEILETPVTVYNFEVEDFHTYYVGESSVLVHNDCKSPRFDENQSAVIQIAKEAHRTGIDKASASILWEWAEEYGFGDMSKANHPPTYDSYQGGNQYHMKINGYHINIF